MSSIRKAHTVEIIDKRLRDAEASDAVDPMELIGLHDELAHIERKWRLKHERLAEGQSHDRPLADAKAMDRRFQRLRQLLDVTARRGTGSEPEHRLMNEITQTLSRRQPLVHIE